MNHEVDRMCILPTDFKKKSLARECEARVCQRIIFRLCLATCDGRNMGYAMADEGYYQILFSYFKNQNRSSFRVEHFKGKNHPKKRVH